jgi:hypothetical protein
MRTRSPTICRLMRFPRALTLGPQTLAAIALGFALAGCQPGSNAHPVPSVAQIGGDLKCASGDHGYEDQQAGWGFCYPATWKYNEKSQASQNPLGLDLTFDITNAPCATPPAGSSAAPVCSPNAGLFAFMIISTYERGDSGSLSSWATANLPKSETIGSTITWGNAVDAAKLSDGKRIALTPHHVVIMDLHSGLLDLETEMSSRLTTWKFSY